LVFPFLQMSFASTAHNTLFLLNASSKIWRAIEEFHYRLAEELCNQGAVVVIVLASSVPDEIRRRLESSGAVVRYLAYRDRFAFTVGLRRLVKEYSIRTVHIRFFRMNQWISWCVRLQGVREIFYTDAESNESTASGLKRTLKRLRTSVVTAPDSRVIAISAFVKERLVESGVPASKIAVVYNGINLERFEPIKHAREQLTNSLNLQPDELLVATISRFVDVKRVDVILRASAILKSRGCKFKLVIAGQGGPLESELRQLSESLALRDNVIWYGCTDQPEVLLSAADVFVFASCGEAFGNVLVEAMACATPIVAVKSGATPEIVVDGECGILAGPGDAEGLALAIDDLSRDNVKRERMARAAASRAKEFSVANAVQGTLDVYHSYWSSSEPKSLME
jgi:glycosyltransferase involved in cell wall biosynthesis